MSQNPSESSPSPRRMVARWDTTNKKLLTMTEAEAEAFDAQSKNEADIGPTKKPTEKRKREGGEDGGSGAGDGEGETAAAQKKPKQRTTRLSLKKGGNDSPKKTNVKTPKGKTTKARTPKTKSPKARPPKTKSPKARTKTTKAAADSTSGGSSPTPSAASSSSGAVVAQQAAVPTNRRNVFCGIAGLSLEEPFEIDPNWGYEDVDAARSDLISHVNLLSEQGGKDLEVSEAEQLMRKFEAAAQEWEGEQEAEYLAALKAAREEREFNQGGEPVSSDEPSSPDDSGSTEVSGASENDEDGDSCASEEY